MEGLKSLRETVQTGNKEKVTSEVKELLDSKVNATEILNDGLIGGMLELGVKFKNHECFVPEVLLAARAMDEAVKILEPHLVSKASEKGMGRKRIMILGTVEHDIHDIGKNIVGLMMKGVGFEVIDLGVNVPAQRFVDEAIKNNADIIAMSALLSTTVVHMKETIDLLKSEGKGKSIKTLVGGAVVTREFANKIGADGYAPDAGSGIEIAKELVS